MLVKQLQRSVSRRNVQRIIQRFELPVRTRRRRKWIAQPTVSQEAAKRPDELWSTDFVSDWCVGVRRVLRILTNVDCCTREAMALRGAYTLPTRRVVETLGKLRVQRRRPKELRIDNWPEFISVLLVGWCKLHGCGSAFSNAAPQNVNGENFNRRPPDECLNGHYFVAERDAQPKLDTRRLEYLYERPHSSLGGRRPAEVAAERGVQKPFASYSVDKVNLRQRQYLVAALQPLNCLLLEFQCVSPHGSLVGHSQFLSLQSVTFEIVSILGFSPVHFSGTKV